MSLIDEALKRARQEAARQDSARRYAYPETPAQVPVRDRSRSSLLVGLAAGLVIGGAAIGGTLWLTGGRSGPEEKVAAAAVSPAPAAAAPVPVVIEEVAPAAPAQLETIPALPSPAVEPRAAAPAAPRAAEPAPPPSAIAAPAPEPLVVPPATAEDPAPAPTHAAPDGAAAGSAAGEPGLDGRTFVRELPVPGGGKLELRGIASGSQPAALINGRVLARGEVVEGFTVVNVESRRVELKGYGATVYLSLE